MNSKVFAVVFIFFSPIHGQDQFVDKFIGEPYTVKCVEKQSDNSVRIRFRGYSSALNHREKFYSKQDLIDSRNVPMKTGYKLTHESKSLSLEIEKVSILDAGSYQCFSGKFDSDSFVYTDSKNSEFFLSVHDVNKFEYVFPELGQDKTKYNIEVPSQEIAKFEILKLEFEESKFIGCDGCDGKGEKKAFLFCYGSGQFNTNSSKWQCQNPDMFFALKGAFSTRKEMVLVAKDSCTKDQCSTQKDNLAAENKDEPFLRKLVSSRKNPLVLKCPGHIHARSLVRWEMGKVPLLRSTNGGGLQLDKVADLRIRPDNSLLLRKIPTPENDEDHVNFSCIINHVKKYTFKVQVKNFDFKSTTAEYYKEHFLWSGVVLACQTGAFILGFALLNLFEIVRDKRRFANEDKE